LTIKSTSHTNTFLDATSTRFYTCVCNARQYSVVKDLDCLSNQFQRPFQIALTHC